jgi:predicted nucleotidyltransferase
MTLWNESRPLALEDLRRQRTAILEIAHRHGVRDIRVFGSVARVEADEGSDVDFLVELESGRSLFDLGGLLMDLQEFLGGSVDVVTPAGLRERSRAQVLRDAVPI